MTQEITVNSVVTKTDNYISSELDGGLVMMSLENNSYYGLDEIGKKVIDMAETPVNVQQITETLSKEYDVDINQCQSDVIQLLNNLQKEGIISVT